MEKIKAKAIEIAIEIQNNLLNEKDSGVKELNLVEGSSKPDVVNTAAGAT